MGLLRKGVRERVGREREREGKRGDKEEEV
jgi:hypothetical protein